MNEDGKFWFGIWKLVAITISILIISSSGCTMYSNKIGTEAITIAFEKGADPIAAYCAVWGISASDGKGAVICARK